MNKMLSFLIDESSGKKLHNYLVKNGFDSKYIGDIMPGVSDERVLYFAEKEKRILITNDKDFGKLIFRIKKPSSGVILLRLKEDLPIKRQKYIEQTIKILGNKLNSSFVVVTEGQIRVRNI